MKLDRLGLWSSASVIALVMFAANDARAQIGVASLTGRVIDASTQAPVGDVVVTVTSPNLQGEETVVTDASGQWRLPSLPPGEYTLRLDKESFKPYARGGISLRADSTIRVDAQLLPDSLKEEIVVVAQAPTVDVGSSNTGLSVSNDFARRVPLVRPTSGAGGAVRSFEAAAQATPQATGDAYGTSINGTTSPENNYAIDGLSRNNAAVGVNGARLSVEFVREVNVLTGGYMPEYGAAGGGIVSATTKSGSNEFHGGGWFNITPGGLEGARKRVFRDNQTIFTDRSLDMIADIGGEVGGPIVKDKLWFYTGFVFARTAYNLRRSIINTVSGELFNTRQDYEAAREEAQIFAKLSWAASQNNKFSFSVYTLPSTSGGSNRSPLDNLTGAPLGNLAGAPSALFNEINANSTSVQADWEAQTPSKKVMLKTTFGWMHQYEDTLANDGRGPGDTTGLAAVPRVAWRRNDPGLHTISDFEPVALGQCDPAGTTDPKLCPVLTYASGGPGQLSLKLFDCVTGCTVLTLFGEFLGHHVVKFGIEGEALRYISTRGFSGRFSLRESPSGATFADNRNYSFLVSPDKLVRLDSLRNVNHAVIFGGFVQDSWAVADLFTLNVGARYDAQLMWGGDGERSLVLPNMISPRAGIVWDPSQSGRGKLYGNFSRYYQTAPLNIADRAGSGEPQTTSSRRASTCNPLDLDQLKGSCGDPANVIVSQGAYSPDRKYGVTGAGKAAIDADIKPQFSDEFVFGAEYDIIRNGRIGSSFTHRSVGRVIEDVSRDEAQTYFITNPGEGKTTDFPKPRRVYNAFTFFLQKTFSDKWEALASYTLSFLEGNYAGLFRPESGQLDPLTNSDFDLKSLTVNRSGWLPGDSRHAFKFFGSRQFDTSERTYIQVGAAARAQSGGPTNYLGSHPLYGPSEIFILARGEGNRLPWTFNFDSNVGYTVKLGNGATIAATVDVFNLLNFQEITGRDESYTTSDVNPIVNGKIADLGKLTKSDNNAPLSANEVNKNFSNPTSFQTPRQIRFGLRGTF